MPATMRIGLEDIKMMLFIDLLPRSICRLSRKMPDGKLMKWISDMRCSKWVLGYLRALFRLASI